MDVCRDWMTVKSLELTSVAKPGIHAVTLIVVQPLVNTGQPLSERRIDHASTHADNMPGCLRAASWFHSSRGHESTFSHELHKIESGNDALQSAIIVDHEDTMNAVLHHRPRYIDDGHLRMHSQRIVRHRIGNWNKVVLAKHIVREH